MGGTVCTIWYRHSVRSAHAVLPNVTDRNSLTAGVEYKTDHQSRHSSYYLNIKFVSRCGAITAMHRLNIVTNFIIIFIMIRVIKLDCRPSRCVDLLHRLDHRQSVGSKHFQTYARSNISNFMSLPYDERSGTHNTKVYQEIAPIYGYG